MKDKLQILVYTDEARNDGLVVAPGLPSAASTAIRDRLLVAMADPSAKYVLEQVFNADGIAPCEPHAYDALLRMSATAKH